jgi:hypothetical protein
MHACLYAPQKASEIYDVNGGNVEANARATMVWALDVRDRYGWMEVRARIALSSRRLRGDHQEA